MMQRVLAWVLGATGLTTMWLKVIGGGVLIGALAIGLQRVYHAGYVARDTEARLEHSQALLHAAKETDEIRVAFASLKSKRDKERKNAEQQISNLRVALDAGTLRLSIPTAPAQPGPADPGVGAPEARTELDRSTSEALVAITADGDNAIRDLNECIDQFNEVKDRLNGRPTSP